MKLVVEFGIALCSLLAITGMLNSCSGPDIEPQQQTEVPVSDPFSLPSPGELAAATTHPRGVSAAVLSCTGSEYMTEQGQLVAVEESDLRFTPDFDDQHSGLDRAAWAMYRFNLLGVENTDALSISWATPSEVPADLWLGLSRWAKGSWEWHTAPAGGTLELGWAKPLYSKPPGGDMYVAVVLTGTQEAVLEQLSLNGSSIPSAQLVADPTSGAPPLLVNFDASSSSSPAGSIVKYEWDWDGDGNWDEDTGATPATSYEYAAGNYTAWVRVTDELGGTTKASVSISAAVPTAPWPMFGQDLQHTRRSPYVGAQTNNLKWSYTTGGRVWSCPAIGTDGTVYVGSMDSKLNALNPDGSLKWSYPTGNMVLSSPAISADGTVYVGNFSHSLCAINPDGSLKWSYSTGDQVRSSPAIDTDGAVYVGSYDNNLYAINPDGSLLWSYTTGDMVRSSPAIGADGTVYVGSYDNNLYAINPDGSLKWSYTTGDDVYSSPSIGADGTVYVGSYDHNLYAINPDGSLKWSYTTGDDVLSSPAIGADGTVYVGSHDHNLYAISPDGNLKWSYPTGDIVRSSPAISADGTVYVGSQDNKLYALNPDGSLKWSYTTGGEVNSSPAISADGTVYVGNHDGKLYAFGPSS